MGDKSVSTGYVAHIFKKSSTFFADEDDDAKGKARKVKRDSPFTFTNILWLLAAAGTIYYLEFVTTAFSDTRVYR